MSNRYDNGRCCCPVFFPRWPWCCYLLLLRPSFWLFFHLLVVSTAAAPSGFGSPFTFLLARLAPIVVLNCSPRRLFVDFLLPRGWIWTLKAHARLFKTRSSLRSSSSGWQKERAQLYKERSRRQNRGRNLVDSYVLKNVSIHEFGQASIILLLPSFLPP